MLKRKFAFKIISTLLMLSLLAGCIIIVPVTASAADGSINYLSWGATKMGFDKYAEYLKNNNLIKKRVTVAVIDSGCADHDFLKGRIRSDKYDFLGKDSVPEDKDGHGTRCISVVADCTQGLPVDILPLKTYKTHDMYYDFRNSDGSINWSKVSLSEIKNAVNRTIKAINYAVAHGADVISFSMSALYDGWFNSVVRSIFMNFLNGDELRDAIKNAKDKGVTFVVSSGNDNGDIKYGFPANMSQPLIVGAVESNDVRWSKSNYGSTLDFIAPTNVKTAYLNNTYKKLSGTSCACPHIAAAAAVLKLADPDATPSDIEAQLKSSCRDLGASGWDKYYGWGIPDLSKLVNYPTRVEMNKTNADIEVGKTVSLSAAVYPTNALQRTITWSSSDTKIATVSGGKVTGKAKGVVTITAKTPKGKTAKCMVTVAAKPKYNFKFGIREKGSKESLKWLDMTQNYSNGNMWYAFTPTKTARYDFRIRDEATYNIPSMGKEATISSLDSPVTFFFKKGGKSNNYSTFTPTLTKNKTYGFRIYGYSGLNMKAVIYEIFKPGSKIYYNSNSAWESTGKMTYAQCSNYNNDNNSPVKFNIDCKVCSESGANISCLYWKSFTVPTLGEKGGIYKFYFVSGDLETKNVYPYAVTGTNYAYKLNTTSKSKSMPTVTTTVHNHTI